MSAYDDLTPDARQLMADFSELDIAQIAADSRATLARVRAFAEDMRTWCSPHGVAVDYADRLLAVLDGTNQVTTRESGRGQDKPEYA